MHRSIGPRHRRPVTAEYSSRESWRLLTVEFLPQKRNFVTPSTVTPCPWPVAGRTANSKTLVATVPVGACAARLYWTMDHANSLSSTSFESPILRHRFQALATLGATGFGFGGVGLGVDVEHARAASPVKA